MDKITTVNEVLIKFKEEGYTTDFNLCDNCLLSPGNSLQIYPGDFVVDKHYRFEGPNEPSDVIIYAISSAMHDVKGTLVNRYGIYSGSLTDAMIKALNEKEQFNTRNIEAWRLDKLCQYIIYKHHSYTYQQMPLISALAKKIATQAGHVYPHISKVSQIFDRMAADTTVHMKKEERILFPFIEQLVEAAEENVKINRPFFGTVNNPTQIMEIEHEQAAEDMMDIRKITGNYEIPKNASASLVKLYEKLIEFEADLKTHVYLESNILFPKAILLEKELGLS